MSKNTTIMKSLKSMPALSLNRLVQFADCFETVKESHIEASAEIAEWKSEHLFDETCKAARMKTATEGKKAQAEALKADLADFRSLVYAGRRAYASHAQQMMREHASALTDCPQFDKFYEAYVSAKRDTLNNGKGEKKALAALTLYIHQLNKDASPEAEKLIVKRLWAVCGLRTATNREMVKGEDLNGLAVFTKTQMVQIILRGLYVLAENGRIDAEIESWNGDLYEF